MADVVGPKRFERKREFGSETDRPPHACTRAPHRRGFLELKILRGVANPSMLIFARKKKKMIGIVPINFCPFCGEDLR